MPPDQSEIDTCLRVLEQAEALAARRAAAARADVP